MGADKAREESDLVRVLELTEEAVRLKLALGDTIREGTFAFSRQRYARGPHAVSETQYDLNTMRATTKISATPRSIDGPSGVSAPGSTSYTFNVVETPFDPEPEPEPEPKPAARSGKADDDGLRRRPKVKTNTEKFLERMEALGLRDQLAEVPREADRDDGKDDDASPPPIDIDAIRRKLGPRKPIHWFGGLPSPEMRSAEAAFTRCVQLCARVAEVESELRALTARARVDAVQLREVGDPS